MNVLIVDDRLEDRSLLHDTLQHHDWQVTEATDGIEALNQLRKDRPDLVISDALMPRMDGFTLLRAMKSDPALSNIPFVFYSSAYLEKHEHDLALSLGALAFLVKPLAPDALWQHLSAIVRELSQKQEAEPVRKITLSSDQFLEKYSAMVATKLEKKVRELEQVQEQWEKTFNALHDILTIQNKKMRILQANKAAGECFRTLPEDLIGKYCYEVFSGKPEPCRNCPVFQTINDKKSHSGIVTNEISGKIFAITTAPLLDHDNQLQSIVHIARDITEQERLQDELFQSRKMESIGTLASGIAHDFNNILTAILGYAELARQKIAAGQLPNGYLDEIITAGHRAKDLVRQILTFSRKDKEKIGMMAPYPLVKEALKLIRSSLPTTIAIKEDLDRSSGTILATPGKIHQIVVNLCTNAYQAMEDQKGTLSVSLKRKELTAADLVSHQDLPPGPYLELTVQDTGSGIPLDTLPHIFEPYFTTKDSDKGTGLGLAVVYGIVHSLGGMITVESVLGQGSTFRVCLPALATKIEDAPKAVTEKPKPATGSEGVMVVDDDQMIISMLDIMLERLGYVVSPYRSSLEALAAFTANPLDFDLLITDQTMPDLTGAELTQKVLSIRPDLPVILCTGFSSVLTREQAKAIGIKRYLTKPIEIVALSTAIRDVLKKKDQATK